MNNIKVNYSFISELEGGAQLKGYVPDAANSRSGVTIATGFDIGQRSREDLERMFFIARPSLIDKLVPYCEQHGEHAEMMLKLMPLKVTEDEATLIDRCAKFESLFLLVEKYNQHSAIKFEQLPEPMQTVIASVAFQYGNLAKRCPNFWRTAITQNTKAMIDELVDFGDRYTTRRWREASYLKQAGQ
ncbi:pesticin C-terminus-like muramidase [Pseudoalteromonas sp. TB41]|uniref:pesticin C-terminus-like muramidase n=1 Tax=Pseudoalteromonas sp. TB41 TaxID=985149 RepID=UPI0004183AA7|nr:pesticin C-terminus-like muramidase [Pseudoalteromonas sp. TB41]